ASGSAARAAEASVEIWVPPAEKTSRALDSASGTSATVSTEELGSATPVSGTTVVSAPRAPNTATRGSHRRGCLLAPEEREEAGRRPRARSCARNWRRLG